MWGAVIDGEAADIQLWHATLCAPFEPWMEYRSSHGRTVNVLRSNALDNAHDSSDAYEIAGMHVAALNGVFLLQSDVMPLRLTGIGPIDADGTIATIISASVGTTVGRSTVRATATTGNPTPPTASNAQKIMLLATKNGLVADLLVHRSRGKNWFDLYKTYEAVDDLCKSGAAMETRSWYPGKNVIGEFTRSANRFRHFVNHSSNRGSFVPMSLDDANRLIGRMAQGVLDDLV